MITYDNEKRQMVDIAPAETEYQQPIHPAHVLLPDEIREQLPPLYTNEELGTGGCSPR